MSRLTPTYSVVLRSDLPSRERQLLEHFCCRITSPSVEPLLHLMCTRIDLSHPVYIEMETFKPADNSIHVVRIPHHFVFLISGSESQPPIGFLTDSTG